MGCSTSSSSSNDHSQYLNNWLIHVSDLSLVEESESLPTTILSASDFVIDQYIGEGGMCVFIFFLIYINFMQGQSIRCAGEDKWG